MDMKIVIANEFPAPALDRIKAAVPAATFYYYPSGVLADIPPGVLAQADVFYTGRALPAPAAVPNLKWVQSHSAGVDHMMDDPLFAGGGVQLTTASGVHGTNIGEYIVMMMLALAHRLPVAFGMMQQRRWSHDRPSFLPMELRGATVGLVGYGAIARYTARLCHAFGMRVLALRRRAPGNAQEAGVSFYQRDQLHAMLGECDFVVLTAPLTPDTRHMIDAAALLACKPSAFLVNISRGGLVDEEALVVALRAGQLAGAALDVFEREPLPDDSPLWRMDNVIMTPHIAGTTPNYERRAADLFAENLGRFIAGQPLINQVDFARGY
jgi:phosphoglycerate dehydrogenase-like enzyme